MISLIHPSRGRPEKSFINSSDWMKRAGVEVELIVTVDNSDPHLKDYINYYRGNAYSGDHDNVVQATNHAATLSKGDILVYLSDDFKCFDNWGQVMVKEFEKYSGPTLIKIDDCLQPFHVPVLTCPIMNRELFDLLGYFFHHEFKSMFCDEHLYWKALQLKALRLAPHIKFEHAHVSVGKAPDDDTYRRSARNWDHGKAIFRRHQLAGFP